MMDQHLLMNSLLNQSRPGDLSVGKFLTTLSISGILKDISKGLRSTSLWSKSSRSNCIVSKAEVSNLSLKSSQINVAFCSWLKNTDPEESCREVIKFLMCFIDALAWKNLEFSSPSFTHLIVPLCLQYNICWWRSDANFWLRISLKFHSWRERSLHSSMK